MSNLNTHTEVRDEGNWSYQGWAPRITSDGAMDTFVDGIVTRANAELQQRVGVSWYGATVASAPWATILKAAEMHLAQAFLLEAAAQIAETGSDTNPAPFLGGAAQMQAAAQQRRGDFERMVALTRAPLRPGEHVPYSRSATTSGHVIERFDPV